MPFILIAIVVAVVAYLLVSRSRELFVIGVRDGTLIVVRGTVPQGLLASFRDAIGAARSGKIRAYRTPTGAQLDASGDIDAAIEQRLRNILGLYPMSKLSARPVDKRKAAHDVLTIAWLVDLLRRR